MNFKQKKIIMIGAVGLVVLLLTILAFYFFFNEQEIVNEEHPFEEIVIDDQINPYIYQGLTVEILRMRNHGIIEKMFTMGYSWKNPPEFYYIVEVDGEIGNASVVEGAGGITGSGTFSEWDTFLKECRTNFKVPVEGQKTSNVSISIMEIQRVGLFGKRDKHVEKLSVDLVLDYRTGHWTGDDYLGDLDGYGHVLGDEYEIRFNIYASDYDHDHVPYWTEVNIFGTDPTSADGFDDPDCDGIPTWWELKYGYDPFTLDNHIILDPDLDAMSNINEYKLYRYGADPFYPDVFVEVDFMEKNPTRFFDLDHIMYKETQQMIIEKMSRYGISIYFDDGWPTGPVNGGGEYVDFVETLDEMVGGHMSRWYKNNFPDERKGVFRYLQIVYNAGLITASEFNKFDHILMDSSPIKVYTRQFALTSRLKRVMQAKGILHELGHTMGLVPGAFVGIDNMPQGNLQWPETLTDEEWSKVNKDYRSIMNYNFVFPWGNNIIKDRKFFDFSEGSNGEYDFNDVTHFYLPTFTMDAAILESPRMRDLSFDYFEWIDKDPDPVHCGWIYDENLTKKYESQLSRLRFDIDNAVEYYYRIYFKEDGSQKGRNVRIYSKPNVKPIPALWSLIAEAHLNNQDNTLEFYSFDVIYSELLDRI